ncbi:PLP-dependent aminotransferase family protein [Alkalibacter rhizosphaerae]|uniref:PLP-dependent aminotransferase family protein n=1 Tax=Alkalibacter rhizosphaerae TaxID=2815577 RepID=A0A974XDF4_9FIRM|nr:PLP-dependent aminotransferase family protein [Alkalibacter rhizosphaerae]QSX07691.1 PLP-dependent aminotransferase family protein [Alkalibacter rhizosphaerae]
MIDAFMLKDQSDKHLYLRIYEYYKEQILTGAMTKGEKLPSIRALAKAIHVSKITVEGAYSQLLAEGYIENRPRQGYFAVDLFGYEFSKEAPKVEEPEEERRYVNTGVDQTSLDLGTWRRMYTNVLKDYAELLHDAGSLKGELLLRQQIKEFIAKSRGVVCNANQIVIGSGSQYLLGILCGLMGREIREVIVEDPGFVQARNTFEDHGFPIRAIPVDEEGIQTDLMEGAGRCLAYLSPSHQYPTGSVMTIRRRLEVLQWAKRRQALIVEDDYDSIFRYETEPIPSLQGLDEGRHVVYLGSFSKLLTPAIRISYMVLTEELLEKYEATKHRYTQTASRLEQLTLGYYMKEGHFERHLRRANKMYHKKNELLKELLQQRFGDAIQIIGGNSGLHLMLQMKTEQAAEKLLVTCRNNAIQVEVIPGSDDNGDHILLPYSGMSLDAMKAIFGQGHSVV